jgi:hypothetical protein
VGGRHEATARAEAFAKTGDEEEGGGQEEEAGRRPLAMKSHPEGGGGEARGRDGSRLKARDEPRGECPPVPVFSAARSRRRREERNGTSAALCRLPS